MSASTGRAGGRLQKIGLWGEATRKSQCGTDANRWGKGVEDGVRGWERRMARLEGVDRMTVVENFVVDLVKVSRICIL
jgi:hypothetical protein